MTMIHTLQISDPENRTRLIPYSRKLFAGTNFGEKPPEISEKKKFHSSYWTKFCVAEYQLGN